MWSKPLLTQAFDVLNYSCENTANSSWSTGRLLHLPVFIPALARPLNSKMKMTSAQAVIVLEVEEGATADEIKQAYKKRALKWYTFLVNILATTIFRLLILLQSQANFSSPSRFLKGLFSFSLMR